ncbi:Glutaredoxin domain-containing protein [Aphelenchoides bicaudatus]|nr:Glutaredoxin domain-containing protein [Aphelenchoides bicaudatus]
MGGTLSKKIDDQTIQDEIKDYPVVMYSKPHCGYCKLAKQLFRDESVDFREKDLELIKVQMMNEDKFQQYVNGLVYITRRTTVPQVFICGEFIGGYTELKAMNDAKELWERIKVCSDQYDKVTI